MRAQLVPVLLVFVLIVLAAAVAVSTHSIAPAHIQSRMQRLPRITLWAWERRDDLRALDTRTTALAALDRTIYLDPQGMHTALQRNAVLLPASAPGMPPLARIAVVRIQVAARTPLTEYALDRVADEAVAAATGAAALQIDFDATRSQRAWYRELLGRVRSRLPQTTPLSITALASWCSRDRWLAGLPIDEAVPMLFRMEPDRARADAQSPEYVISDPLCQGSVGLSTSERWPNLVGPHSLAGVRIYLFPEHGWSEDNIAQTVAELP